MMSISCFFLQILFMLSLQRGVSAFIQDCGCGLPTAKAASGSRIIGGTVVDPYSIPYQAAVEPCYETYGCQASICGGTLINKRHVITAMHCVVMGLQKEMATNQSTVRLGAHKYYDKNDGVRVGVEGIIGRDEYKAPLEGSDIAIIRLSRDIDFGDPLFANVAPACLPQQMNSSTLVGRDAVVSGWGVEEYKSFGPSAELRKTTVQIVPQEHQTCKRYNVKQAVLCAFANGTDSCQGDSGGPLIVKDTSGRDTLVGVVSFGVECAHPEYAGVYTDVTAYLPWIRENVQDGWCMPRDLQLKVTKPSLATTSAMDLKGTTAAPSPPPAVADKMILDCNKSIKDVFNINPVCHFWSDEQCSGGLLQMFMLVECPRKCHKALCRANNSP